MKILSEVSKLHDGEIGIVRIIDAFFKFFISNALEAHRI
jgi:hypothetical protein